MTLQPRIVATAGHIDHGKSTLVEVLTGTHPDRLPEEKKRGMTIELGFAHLNLLDGDTLWHAGIVDVPGHADFVRNMVAGVGSIDAALLIVAADDGWMPQTEEHFQILLHLGVSHGLVALTKSDLVPDPATAVEAVRAHLAGTAWEDAPIVPVCAPQGLGVEALRAALTSVLRRTPPPPDTGRPRLFVDRVFSPRGSGTVVTGTLSGGALHLGDTVFIQPAGFPAKIRGLQNHGCSVERALPGMRTAIQLAGVEAAWDGEGEGVWRGHVVEGGRLTGAAASDVMHVWLQRLNHTPDAAGAPPVKHGCEVWLHHGSGSHRARLYLAESRTLAPGAGGIAELRTETPVAVLAGDRFVLRDISRRVTLAGGMVLEPTARPRVWKRPRFLQSLRLRAAHPSDAALWVRDLMDRDGWLQPEGLLQRSHFTAEEIAAALTSSDGLLRGGWMFSPACWNAAKELTAAAVQKHHEARPCESGVALSTLRQLLHSRLPDAASADALMEELTTSGLCVRDQSTLRAAGFKIAISPELRRACLAIRGALYADKLNPPALSSFVQAPIDRAALAHMLKTGEVFYLTPEIAMLTAGWDMLKQRILEHLSTSGPSTVAQLRDAIALNRRILIPACERLDREGATVREGDLRRVATR